MNNPFFKPASTPFEAFDFNKLTNEHFVPAFKKGMSLQKQEIDAIIQSNEDANFYNTIEALEKSGELLNHVCNIFFNLNHAETSEEIQEIAQKMMPLLTEHENSITLNTDLFNRIKTVYNNKQTAHLTIEQERLIETTYQDFCDNGGELSTEAKEKYKQLSTLLSVSTLQFGENSLKALNEYYLHIQDKNQLKGIPEYLINQFKEKANKKQKGGWIIDLRITSFQPVLKYAEDRTLRETLYKAFVSLCTKNSTYDNSKLIQTIVNTRLEIAQLFHFTNYADYALKRKMAKNKETVYSLLDQLKEAYSPKAKEELEELESFAQTKGFNEKIQAWDFAYYNNQLKEAIYRINDQALKVYFPLEKVIDGVFGLAHKLYRIKFVEHLDIPVYHKEVKTYEVIDEKTKQYLGLLYTDFHPREGKQAGAWMTEFKEQYKENTINHRPHVSIVMNFTKGNNNEPTLLLLDEVRTFLHEFGHALHSILSQCHYKSISGTNVYRDFVELPSQIMENWLLEPEFLNSFAYHYKTSELIPISEVNKLKEADNFSCGYACLRQLGFAYQDMAFHTITEKMKKEHDVLDFEYQHTKQVATLPHIPNTGRCTTFSHIFSGGYAAGYYGYKWAEVLDADAYSLFKEKGIYNENTAHNFRENILSKGNTHDPMTLYKNFRGREPKIEALLKRENILKK